MLICARIKTHTNTYRHTYLLTRREARAYISRNVHRSACMRTKTKKIDQKNSLETRIPKVIFQC